MRIADRFQEFERKPGWRRFVSVASFPAAYVVVTSSPSCCSPGFEQGRARSLTPIEYVLNVGWFAMGAVMAAVIARNRRYDWHTWLGGLIIIASVGTLILALVTSATTIYPSLPTWLGEGGRTSFKWLRPTCPRFVPHAARDH